MNLKDFTINSLLETKKISFVGDVKSPDWWDYQEKCIKMQQANLINFEFVDYLTDSQRNDFFYKLDQLVREYNDKAVVAMERCKNLHS